MSLPLLPRLRRRLPSTAAVPRVARKLQIYKLLQVAPLGYLQVDEENQCCGATNKRGSIGSARWEPRQVRLLVELVRTN